MKFALCNAGGSPLYVLQAQFRELGLEEIAAACEKQQVSGKELSTMSQDDLASRLGLAAGDETLHKVQEIVRQNNGHSSSN